ncbi:unnamed protein product, partial [marine sediment metagenome]
LKNLFSETKKQTQALEKVCNKEISMSSSL